MRNLLAYLFAPSVKLLLLAFLLCLPAHAQDKKAIDSLMRVYNTAKHDTTKILALTSIAHEYRNNKPDTCIAISKQMLSWSKKIQFKKGEANSLYNLGIANFYQANYPLALDYAQKSLKIRKEIKDKRGISNTLNLKGLIHRNNGSDALALDYFQQSLAIKEEINDRRGMAVVLGNIGNIYYYQHRYTEALTYHQKGLKINAKIGFDDGVSLNNIGLCYIGLKDYERGMHDLFSARKIIKKNNNNGMMGENARWIAESYLTMKEYANAKLYADTAIIYTKKTKDAKNISKAYKVLYEVHKHEKDYAKAIEYHEIHKQLQDSIFSAEKSKAISYLESKAVLEKKDLEIEKEKEAKRFQQYINYLVLAGLVSMVVFAYFILRSRHKINQERAKSDKLLLNILPAETATELKEKGFATPKHYELITVLFTDFKGFTNIAEKMTPTEVIENLNTCFYALDLICDKYGLEKIKTIGDSYMCAGGLPIANTTNPVDVVSAGLEMQVFMANWKAEKESQGLPAWELRLGIHSGEAVAGVVGKNKFAYDIWGDTVNLASRMESSGEVGKVNISGATYELVKDKFVCTHRGAVKAKNKGEVEMYFVEEAIAS